MLATGTVVRVYVADHRYDGALGVVRDIYPGGYVVFLHGDDRHRESYFTDGQVARVCTTCLQLPGSKCLFDSGPCR